MKKRNIILLCVVFIVLILSIVFYIIIRSYEGNGGLYVFRVIDGDTIEMSDGSVIRLLCVDAPEKGEEGFDEARVFLEHLILGEEVRLVEAGSNNNGSGSEQDSESAADKYGRDLRYVYVNVSDEEILVNKEIVRLGFGEVFEYGENCSLVKG